LIAVFGRSILLFVCLALSMAAAAQDGLESDLLGDAAKAANKIEKENADREAAAKAGADAARKRKESRALLWAPETRVKHPRIIVTPERLAVARREMKTPGTHYHAVYESLRSCYQGDLTKEWLNKQEWINPSKVKRWPGLVVKDLALLSLIAEDPAEQRRYAEAAARFLPDPETFLWRHFTGNLGTPVGVSTVSMAYDWGFNQFTSQERAKFEAVMDACANRYGEGEELTERETEALLGGPGYNHHGVKAGAEVMLRLAAGYDKLLPGQFDRSVQKLRLYLEGVGGELGAHREGLGYTEYPMSFALPAVVAARALGDARLTDAAKKHAFWLLNMYAQTFMTTFNRKYVQYGTDHESNFNQGFATCVIDLCPRDILPYYLWWYDRHMGRLSKAEPDQRFDSHRNTRGIALLIYPHDVEPRDPTSILPGGVVDRKHGCCFFRNRWKDENDIQVAFLAGNREGAGGWHQYEHLSLRLMAYDTRFFGGPGKEKSVPHYTTLLVDGVLEGTNNPAFRESPEGRSGRLVDFEAAKDGGYAIVDKGKSGPVVGIENATRHLLVKFLPPDTGAAILSTLDDIVSAKEHVYTWQANLGPPGEDFTPKLRAASAKSDADVPSLEQGSGADGDSSSSGAILLEEKTVAKPAVAKTAGEAAGHPIKSDDGIVSSQGTEAGRPFFLLKGRNGYVKGWVLHPADATIKVGDPLQIETKGANARIWLAMYVGSGEPCVARIAASGMESRLDVAGRTIRFDGQRVRCE
jgi:hypothetical protein